MDSERIKEIQKNTAYPESRSVMLALKQVWNECEQEKSYKEHYYIRYVLQNFIKQIKEDNEFVNEVNYQDINKFLDKFK